MTENYSKEFGRKWENKYWKDGKLRRKPTQVDNYKGEGYEFQYSLLEDSLVKQRLSELRKSPRISNIVLVNRRKFKELYALYKRSLEFKVQI